MRGLCLQLRAGKGFPVGGSIPAINQIKFDLSICEDLSFLEFGRSSILKLYVCISGSRSC